MQRGRGGGGQRAQLGLDSLQQSGSMGQTRSFASPKEPNASPQMQLIKRSTAGSDITCGVHLHGQRFHVVRG